MDQWTLKTKLCVRYYDVLTALCKRCFFLAKYNKKKEQMQLDRSRSLSLLVKKEAFRDYNPFGQLNQGAIPLNMQDKVQERYLGDDKVSQVVKTSDTLFGTKDLENSADAKKGGKLVKFRTRTKTKEISEKSSKSSKGKTAPVNPSIEPKMEPSKTAATSNDDGGEKEPKRQLVHDPSATAPVNSKYNKDSEAAPHSAVPLAVSSFIQDAREDEYERQERMELGKLSLPGSSSANELKSKDTSENRPN